MYMQKTCGHVAGFATAPACYLVVSLRAQVSVQGSATELFITWMMPPLMVATGIEVVFQSVVPVGVHA